jgi:hypothetical protein
VGAGRAIAVSILAWSLAEIAEAWLFFRIPPLSWHFLQSLFFAAVAFGCAAFLQGRVPVAVHALTVGCLYAGLSVAFGFTASDRDLVRRGIKKTTSLLMRTSEVLT